MFPVRIPDCTTALLSLWWLALFMMVAGCDGGESEGVLFEDVGPGTLIGEANAFTWSSDGDRLYFTTRQRIGGPQESSRYRIYESAPGGTPQLLFEGMTEYYNFACPSVHGLVEVGGTLYYSTDSAGPVGNIYRLPLVGSDEAEVAAADGQPDRSAPTTS